MREENLNVHKAYKFALAYYDEAAPTLVGNLFQESVSLNTRKWYTNF